MDLYKPTLRKTRRAKAEGRRPEGCSKGCTGRMCRDALNCDAKRHEDTDCLEDHMPAEYFTERA